MNGYFITAGILSIAAAFGHAFAGRSLYLLQMLSAIKGQVHRQVLLMLWHSTSAIFLIFGLLLLLLGFEVRPISPALVISIYFLIFAACNLGMGMKLGVIEGSKKMFQWTIFLAIAVLAYIGQVA